MSIMLRSNNLHENKKITVTQSHIKDYELSAPVTLEQSRNLTKLLLNAPENKIVTLGDIVDIITAPPTRPQSDPSTSRGWRALKRYTNGLHKKARRTHHTAKREAAFHGKAIGRAEAFVAFKACEKAILSAKTRQPGTAVLVWEAEQAIVNHHQNTTPPVACKIPDPPIMQPLQPFNPVG